MNDTNLSEARESSLQLASLLRREQGSQADFLVALAAFDEAGAYRRLGYANLFEYLHRELLLPRSSAHYRKVAARLLRRFPEIVQPLRNGKLCLSTVVEVEKVLTEANRAEVLPRFFGLSRQEAKEVVAELLPAPVVPRRTIVTELPVVALPVTLPPETQARTCSPGELDRTRPEWVPSAIEPMTATASRMHLTVSREFVALLKKAKAGQSHVQPNATDEQVLTAALELLVEKQEKRKASVPAKVKREVRARDGGKCQWKLASGGICGSEARLEIDHVHPRAKGGPSTVENCRVLCRAHNLEAAREAYGDPHMDLFTRSVPVAREPVAEWVDAKPTTSLPVSGSGHIFLGDASNPANGFQPPTRNGERHDDPDPAEPALQRLGVPRLEGRLRGQLPRHRPRRVRDPDLLRADPLLRFAARGFGLRDGLDHRVTGTGGQPQVGR